MGIGRSPVRGIIQSYFCSFKYAWPISGARENKIEGHQLQQTAVSVADKHYVQAGDIHSPREVLSSVAIKSSRSL
jgi:hypothetical protein